MKHTMTKLILPLSIILFGMTGCFSSDSQADSSQKTEKPASSATSPAAEEKKMPTYVEGKHYFEIFPELNTTAEQGKVEVIELFWLGCPHCYHLEPTIQKYKESMPDYIEFKQIPAVLNPNWALHAKAFFTAQFLDPNDEKKLVTKLFEEIHEKKNNLGSLAKIKTFFSENGYSDIQFNNTYNSMAVSAAMANAAKVSAGSQANSVPTIIINGKYRTSPSAAKGESNLLNIIQQLTEMEKPQKK